MTEVSAKTIDDFIGKNDIGTLVRKFQKCGKKCRTCREGKGHGPYWWAVTYDKTTKTQRWKYYGKNKPF